jgi:hypothetical protein
VLQHQGPAGPPSAAAAALVTGSAAQTAASTARITAQLSSSLGSSLGAGGSRQTGAGKQHREGEVMFQQVDVHDSLGTVRCVSIGIYGGLGVTGVVLLLTQHDVALRQDPPGHLISAGHTPWPFFWHAPPHICSISWLHAHCTGLTSDPLPMPLYDIPNRPLQQHQSVPQQQQQQQRQQQCRHPKWPLPAGVCRDIRQPCVAVGGAAASLPTPQLPGRCVTPAHHCHQQQHTGAVEGGSGQFLCRCRSTVRPTTMGLIWGMCKGPYGHRRLWFAASCSTHCGLPGGLGGRNSPCDIGTAMPATDLRG